MEVIQKRLYLHLSRSLQNLIAIKSVLINGNIAVQSQFKDICKEVHLFPYGFHREVETRVSLFIKTNLSINITTPHHILGHINSRGILQSHTLGHTLVVCIRLLLLLLLWLQSLCLLLLLDTRFLRLGSHSTCCQRYHHKEQ